MKLSFTKVIGAIALCLGLLLTTQVLAQQNQSSPLTNDEAISILQKAPGGSNLNFASSDHRWQSRTSEMTTGDAFIWAIAIEGTKVYVGGEFSSINGIPMNNVGVYDLESQIWSPITAVINSESINGVPGRVYAIDTIDDDVIIAGSFNFIHPIDGSLNGIVRYNTSSQYFYGFKTGNDTQYGVGGGFIYTIKAALMPGKTANFSNGGPNYVVLVGGSFTTAGGEAAPYLAYFDFNGDGWQPIYHLLQFDDSVYDVMIDGMTLIVAGQFTNVNSVPGTAGIVVLSLTDDNIISVGGGITEGFRVHSIEKIGNELYIGGFFSRVGDVPVNNFARFDMYSNQWSALNTNFNGTVHSLKAVDNILYVGGSFSRVTNDIVANRLAYLNTTDQSWRAAGSGINGGPSPIIYDLGYFSGEINGSQQDLVLTGGMFAEAGGYETYNFASWNTSSFIPAKLDLQSPADLSTNLSITPTLSWDSHFMANLYHLQISTTTDFEEDDIVYERDNIEFLEPGKVAVITTSVSVEHTVETDLQNNTTYYWRVRGIGDDGIGEWSDDWSFETIVQKVTLVSPVDESTTEPLTPDFVWETLENVIVYQLTVSKDPDLSDPVIDETINISPFKSLSEISSHHTYTYTPDSPLDYGTQYYWNVVGYNSSSELGESDEPSMFVTIPLVPDKVELSSPGDNQNNITVLPTFQWYHSMRTVKYTFQLATDFAFENIVLDEEILLTVKSVGDMIADFIPSFTPEEDLDHDTQYYWRVRGENPGGLGEWSDVWTFRTLWPVPDQIVLVSPSNGAGGQPIRPTLIWNEVQYANWYYLEIYTNSNYTGDPVYIKDEIFGTSGDAKAVFDSENSAIYETVEFTLDEDLEIDQTYFWRVRGTNNTGDGVWSASRSFTVGALVPEMVNLLNPNNGQTDVALEPAFRWAPAERADSYRLQVSTVENFSSTIIDDRDIQTTTHTSATKLAGSTVYFYRVRGINNQGAGAWSTVRTFTTTQDVPAQVSIRNPNNNETNVSLTPTFTWLEVSGASSYHLQVSREENFANNVIDLEGITTNMVEIVQGSLRGSTTYRYRVRARNSVGYGPWSLVRAFTTVASTTPGSVKDIVVRQVSAKQVLSKTHSVQNTAAFEISWTPPDFDGGSDITNYRIIYRKADESTWTTYQREASTDTVAIVTGFESGVSYAFDVLAENSVGASAPTPNPPVAVSIETEEIPGEITLSQNYPNPFNPTTNIRFSLPTSGDVRLEVYSMLGQQMTVLVSGQQPAGWHTVSLDASTWSSGTYLYILRTADASLTKKFVLIK